MANTTISALPSATTPLAGTEVVPIVQSGTTKKVAVSNLISLTTTGTSGAATFVNSVLNIPQYSGGGGSGTVTSVGLSAPAFLSVTGSPVTTSGTLALSYSGTALPVANGGTGQTTANAALNGLLPAQTSQSGKVLSTDGTNTSWIASGGTGTVTSVAMSVPTFLSVTGSPITASGTLAVSLSGTALPVANGGTGATTATAAFDALAPSQTANSGKYLTTNGTTTSWATVSGTGTVTSVAQTFTGGLISVSGSPITTSGTLGLTVAGTSGGIPYFSSGTTWATSAALASNALVVGGGAGAAPATVTTGTGVVTALGVATGTAGAFVVNGGALGTPSSGTVTNLTGTASININGTVGATTPTTGVFTTATARSTAVQDSVILQGRAGGTNSYGVTLTPTTLTGSRTLTLPDASGTILQSGTAVTVGQGGTGITSGTSGGIPYFSSTSAVASSAALAANALVIGGGAGATPATVSNITSNNSYLQLGASTPLRFADADSSNYVSFQAPATVSSNVAWTLPSTDGTSGQVLSTDGSGGLSWITVSSAPTTLTVNYIVIAGGGGGGVNGGGGGGAGGYRSSISGESSGGGASAETPLTLNLNQAYQVTVGAFGTGPTYPNNPGNGGNSTFSSIVSTGGGGGGGNGIPGAGGQNGGSGGGGGAGTGAGAGTGTANQGYTPTSSGGGGAGSDSTNANGGNGVSSSITGSSVARAGGGGGARYTGGSGTAGGGGGGTYPTPANGIAATANTGGGGGAGSYGSGNGGNGGTGVIFLKIDTARTATFTGGVSSSVATVGAYKIYTITAAGSGDTVTFT